MNVFKFVAQALNFLSFIDVFCEKVAGKHHRNNKHPGNATEFRKCFEKSPCNSTGVLARVLHSDFKNQDRLVIINTVPLFGDILAIPKPLDVKVLTSPELTQQINERIINSNFVDS